MTFKEEKLFSTGGVAFLALLTLLNFDAFPSFYWLEFQGAMLAMAIVGAGVFYRQRQPGLSFYVWGLLPWSSLYVAYSCLTLGFLSRLMGSTALCSVAVLWFVGSAILLRTSIRLEDGPPSANSGLMAAFAKLGAGLSGLLVIYIGRDTLDLVLGIGVNALMAFATYAWTALWLRRIFTILKRRRQALANAD